jgi:hypothetical protein
VGPAEQYYGPTRTACGSHMNVNIGLDEPYHGSTATVRNKAPGRHPNLGALVYVVCVNLFALIPDRGSSHTWNFF